MKIVIITLEDAKKTELKGAEKLSKNDVLIMLSTKNKSDMPGTVKTVLEDVKAELLYVKLESASEVTANYAYYAGYHQGKGHETFIVAPDKTKLPSNLTKEIKVYTSFASVVKSTSSSSSSKSGSSSKKTSSSGSTESTIADTISGLTGLSKSDSKKLVNAAADMFKNK